MSQDRVLHDCMAISSGTLSYLIDCREYETLDKVQSNFVLWVASYPGNFENWQAAWQAFVNQIPYIRP